MSDSLPNYLKKAGEYGLQEFLEIMGELSQESTKKGLLSRQMKELITLGIALYKDCHRCIDIHSRVARQLDSADDQFDNVRKVVFFMIASTHGRGELWDDWVINWKDFSYSRFQERRQLREMVALAISIVMQDSKQIDLHIAAALDAGMTIEQCFEVVPLVMLMDGAPTLSQIPQLFKAYADYQASDA